MDPQHCPVGLQLEPLCVEELDFYSHEPGLVRPGLETKNGRLAAYSQIRDAHHVGGKTIFDS
jgi:hypothetical protein